MLSQKIVIAYGTILNEKNNFLLKTQNNFSKIAVQFQGLEECKSNKNADKTSSL